MKKVPLSKTDRLVIESLIRREHRDHMLAWQRWNDAAPGLARPLMVMHHHDELERIEHVANSMGFGPL